MLLTLTTTHSPATDLGYLLHKNPTRVQSFDLNFGKAHVFYAEANESHCTAALFLDINAVELVRRDSKHSFALEQYVNDRPYVASSFMSVAIAQVYGSALNGKSKDRQELADTAIPLEAKITALPCRGGEGLLRGLFEPFGYTIHAERYPLDTAFPSWGQSTYYTLTLTATTQLQALLSHLYVLIPVLDDDKHYYVSNDEVEKLLRYGDGWLNTHPLLDLITRRYLKHQRSLTRDALSQILQSESTPSDLAPRPRENEETRLEEKINLHQQRLNKVTEVIKKSGAHQVVDLGCGEGKLLALLLKEAQFTRVLGMDVSYRSLEIAEERLHLDKLAPHQRQRIELIHGSLIYRDERLSGYDAAALVEVIEHLDTSRLAALERVAFEFARPTTVVITTPNAEYNVMWESLPHGKFRHSDHRFEWTRTEFQAWAQGICKRFGYGVEFIVIGEEDTIVGAPSQMAMFVKEDKR